LVIIDRIYDFVFPKEKHCAYCGAECAHGQVCVPCKAKLAILKVDNHLPSSDTSIEKIGVKSCYYYDDIAKEIVISYKYGRNSSLYLRIAKEIVTMLAENNITADFISYVPLHKSKKATRGFDQAKKIAIGVSYLTDIPYLKTLNRIKKTDTQAGLSEKLREQNVKNAFILNSRKILSEKSVIIIDDVTTTGSTLNACINTLKLSGSTKIIPVAFASTKFVH